MAAGTVWHSLVERLPSCIESASHIKTHAKAVTKPHHALANICLGMAFIDDALTHTGMSKTLFTGLFSAPQMDLMCFNLEEIWNLLKKKTPSDIATQTLLGRNWLFLVVCVYVCERESEWDDTRVFTRWRLAVHIQISHHMGTHTHAKPQIPWCVMTGCNCQHALLQLWFSLTILRSSLKCLSCSSSLLPSSFPPPPRLSTFSLLSSLYRFLFFPSSTVWMTSLMSSLEALLVVLKGLWKALKQQQLLWICL